MRYGPRSPSTRHSGFSAKRQRPRAQRDKSPKDEEVLRDTRVEHYRLLGVLLVVVLSLSLTGSCAPCAKRESKKPERNQSEQARHTQSPSLVSLAGKSCLPACMLL